MKQIETFLKKFPDLTDSQLVSDEMMEQTEGGGECKSCQNNCKNSCQVTGKEGCVATSKSEIAIPIGPINPKDPTTDPEKPEEPPTESVTVPTDTTVTVPTIPPPIDPSKSET